MIRVEQCTRIQPLIISPSIQLHIIAGRFLTTNRVIAPYKISLRKRLQSNSLESLLLTLSLRQVPLWSANYSINHVDSHFMFG